MPSRSGSSSERPRRPRATEPVGSQTAKTVNVADADAPGPDNGFGAPDTVPSEDNSDSLDKPEPSRQKTIAVRSLSQGTVLDEDVFDGNGVLLLRSGHKITAHFLTQLERRGTVNVVSGSRRSGAEQTPEPAKSQDDGEPTEAAITAPKIEHTVATSNFDAEMPKAPAGFSGRLGLLKLKTELQEEQQGYRVLIDRCTTFIADLVNEETVELDPIAALLSRYVDMFGKDRSLGVLRIRNDACPESYLLQHGVNVAILTMNIALHMGFREDRVIEAGLGAMLHDTGMLKVPEALWKSPRKLTESELFEIRRHPRCRGDIGNGSRPGYGRFDSHRFGLGLVCSRADHELQAGYEKV